MTRMAMVDGTTYKVRTGGEGGTRAPVLLLHGFTGRASDWSPFVRSIRDAGHRTIVVDLLGHGRSDSPADPARHAIERQAEDIAAILRQLDAAPAFVVGYSMGARLALRLALIEPTLVRGLVLESPSAGIADARERAARVAADRSLADRIERDGVEAFVNAWEALAMFAPERRLSAAARARLHRDRVRHRPAGLANSLRGAGQGVMEPLDGRLKQIRSPALVIAGALDTTGVERAVAVARRVPTVRMLILPERGHAPHREARTRFRQILLEQLATWSTT
ncbi:MAG: 2-succinyl-6-hydroxy-2,4-cyclohexadiene-1-carboxylate synthase [Candidatus Limnocylindrales bacterium]